MNSNSDKMTLEVRVSNKRSVRQTFYLEPLGEKYTVLPGKTLRVAIWGRAPHVIEWEFVEGETLDEASLLTIGGPLDTEVNVYDGETLLVGK